MQFVMRSCHVLRCCLLPNRAAGLCHGRVQVMQVQAHMHQEQISAMVKPAASHIGQCRGCLADRDDWAFADAVKRGKALQKKLRQIQQLKDKAASGTTLEPEQVQKIAGEKEVLAELQCLGLNT